MKGKMISAISFILMLTSILTPASNTQPIEASGTIYIRADGSVDPPDAPVITVNNVTYTLIGNITSTADGIVIERNNITIDGVGYAVKGVGTYGSKGIYLSNLQGVTIKNVKITGFWYGVWLWYSSNNSICGNYITVNNGCGIYLSGSANNNITGNCIANNSGGVRLHSSSNNYISLNDVTANNGTGIYLSDSSNNSVCGNNVTANNGRGIMLPNCSGNSITGNHIARNNAAGIWLNGSSGSSIARNYITANNGCGVLLIDSSNNSIYRNNSTAQIWNGITLYSSSSNSIGGNHITANNKYGIHLYGSSNNNSVSGNFITANFWHGIYLYYAFNNSVYGNNITANIWRGISLSGSSNNNIAANNITVNNDGGISLSGSPHNNISENVLISNDLYIWDSYENLVWNNTVNGKPLVYLESVSDLTVGDDAGQVVLVNCNRILVENLNISNTNIGIQLWKTNNTKISKNNVANNDVGIRLWYSSSNSIYHNNFVNNTCQIYSGSSSNSWDNGYPSGGNYWSNYAGVDENSDGIGDNSFGIDKTNLDRYPLMGMFSEFNVTSQSCCVQTICNSSISNFQFNGTAIKFNITGEEGTIGFCRILIPPALKNATYKVFVNSTEISYTVLPFSNSTHSILYFTYNHSTQEVIITPEFQSMMILPLLISLSILAIWLAKRKFYAKPMTKQTQFDDFQ